MDYEDEIRDDDEHLDCEGYEDEGRMPDETTPLELFVDRGTTIVDQDRKPYTIDEAKAAWEAGKVTNYNLAFYRLATRANWDFAELKRQYAEMDAARDQD